MAVFPAPQWSCACCTAGLPGSSLAGSGRFFSIRRSGDHPTTCPDRGSAGWLRVSTGALSHAVSRLGADGAPLITSRRSALHDWMLAESGDHTRRHCGFIVVPTKALGVLGPCQLFAPRRDVCRGPFGAIPLAFSTAHERKLHHDNEITTDRANGTPTLRLSWLKDALIIWGRWLPLRSRRSSQSSVYFRQTRSPEFVDSKPVWHRPAGDIC